MIMVGGIGCPSSRDHLALAWASRSGRPLLISPDRGCIFKAAAFDRGGIVAAEGCNAVGGYLRDAYALRYGPTVRVTLRIPLHLGREQAALATEPSRGAVLITQDQPGNEPYPERDWVYEFDRHRLRPIAHDKADDAAQVLAVPCENASQHKRDLPADRWIVPRVVDNPVARARHCRIVAREARCSRLVFRHQAATRDHRPAPGSVAARASSRHRRQPRIARDPQLSDRRRPRGCPGQDVRGFRARDGRRRRGQERPYAGFAGNGVDAERAPLYGPRPHRLI